MYMCHRLAPTVGPPSASFPRGKHTYRTGQTSPLSRTCQSPARIVGCLREPCTASVSVPRGLFQHGHPTRERKTIGTHLEATARGAGDCLSMNILCLKGKNRKCPSLCIMYLISRFCSETTQWRGSECLNETRVSSLLSWPSSSSSSVCRRWHQD